MFKSMTVVEMKWSMPVDRGPETKAGRADLHEFSQSAMHHLDI